jgi:hypothetical protein
LYLPSSRANQANRDKGQHRGEHHEGDGKEEVVHFQAKDVVGFGFEGGLLLRSHSEVIARARGWTIILSGIQRRFVNQKFKFT